MAPAGTGSTILHFQRSREGVRLSPLPAGDPPGSTVGATWPASERPAGHSFGIDLDKPSRAVGSTLAYHHDIPTVIGELMRSMVNIDLHIIPEMGDINHQSQLEYHGNRHIPSAKRLREGCG